jgi:hypothetical protein
MAVGMHDALVVGQVPPRVFALAVGAIGKPERRRRIAPGRAFVAHIGPQPPRLGPPCAAGKRRDRGVVTVQGVAGEGMAADRLEQGRQHWLPSRIQSARVERESSTPSRA